MPAGINSERNCILDTLDVDQTTAPAGAWAAEAQKDERGRFSIPRRHFPVTCRQIKKSADQTATATAEISEQLTSIQNSTSNVVQAIQRVTHTVHEIDTSTSAISAAVEQQGATTREIVQAVNQASVGTGEVTSNITGVASAAEQTSVAAHQVQGASADLAKEGEQLRYQVDTFLSNVPRCIASASEASKQMEKAGSDPGLSVGGRMMRLIVKQTAATTE